MALSEKWVIAHFRAHFPYHRPVLADVDGGLLSRKSTQNPPHFKIKRHGRFSMVKAKARGQKLL